MATDKKQTNKKQIGKLYRIAGPVVVARGLQARMYDVVRVGNERLMGEVIKIDGEDTIIQVYEDTTGITPGEPVENTGERLSVELGPGLLTSIYDGIQRPLPVLQAEMGDFIFRGVDAPGLDHKKRWDFKALVNKGEAVKGGDVIGEVKETETFTHKIMVPPSMEGKVKEIKSGKFTVDEIVCVLDNDKEIMMMQKWPVRMPRPYRKKQAPSAPLLTGQRIFDVFFPVAKGGAAAIPGPFGAGKTVSQQQLAKWCDADIIVYVGCGERGNEMTEVLTEFPHLKDPRTNGPLMNRTVLIANTSNMPVAAREASVYTGATIAEYFRDMGLHVAMMADSSSRWAEAMREISSRLEEMPGEEGYPAYLATRLAEFYERAGMVEPLGVDNEGSVTLIGAVSPPGGDFSEPVTQNTLRVTKTFWALDAKLAQRRHFPSVNWLTSYTLYMDSLEPWFAKNVAAEWRSLVSTMMKILQEEDKLLEIVQLVGSDSLPPKQQLTLEVARLIREFVLQQNAFHDIDTYCELKKSYTLMKTILLYADLAQSALDDQGARVQDLLAIKAKDRIGEAKFEKDYQKLLKEVQAEMETEFKQLR
ncbi:V-type ATP synthase subunit A [Candidatus Woesearchaeota archaeon CG10_big_fil_rev_8_21_14_0_10_45_16]|nr:MAG: V-type ATP synthase subunit A [Candidatus Woesearchaeota archaeon CG10_big_fil_rev_8_21_14_0_10_45_16]